MRLSGIDVVRENLLNARLNFCRCERAPQTAQAKTSIISMTKGIHGTVLGRDNGMFCATSYAGYTHSFERAY